MDYALIHMCVLCVPTDHGVRNLKALKLRELSFLNLLL